MGLFSLLGEAYHRLVWGKRIKKPYEFRIEILMFDKNKLKKTKTRISEKIPLTSGGYAQLILRPENSMKNLRLKAMGFKPKFYNIIPEKDEEEKVEEIKDNFIDEYKEKELTDEDIYLDTDKTG